MIELVGLVNWNLLVCHLAVREQRVCVFWMGAARPCHVQDLAPRDAHQGEVEAAGRVAPRGSGHETAQHPSLLIGCAIPTLGGRVRVLVCLGGRREVVVLAAWPMISSQGRRKLVVEVVALVVEVVALVVEG